MQIGDDMNCCAAAHGRRDREPPRSGAVVHQRRPRSTEDKVLNTLREFLEDVASAIVAAAAPEAPKPIQFQLEPGSTAEQITINDSGDRR